MTRLIFCFDGTCNDPEDAKDFSEDGSISNILKLHILFGGNLRNEPYKTPAGQHSFYYSGVGTRGNWIKRTLNTLCAPCSGDMKDIIKQATADLQNFKKGDTVSIFGFSRGAAIARIFAAKIRERNPKVTTVNFLGVFDTVAAIKGSRDLKKSTYPASGILFENGTLGQHVQSAVHLLAIDEKRLMFQPTLFNSRENVKEVWFAGVHSDIGGGYWFDGLSDITLQFMCGEAENAGLTLLEPQEINYAELQGAAESKDHAINRDDIEIQPLYKGVLHELRRPGVIAEYTLAPRLIRVDVDGNAPAGLPVIHHTVCERFREVTGYRPLALRNRKYRVMEQDGDIGGEPRSGIAGLR